MEMHSNVVLNDGSPTGAASNVQSTGLSTSKVSLVDMADCFSWETIPELGWDHHPLLLIRDNDIKVESDHTRRRPNYPKAVWPLFHKCLNNGSHAVLSVGSLSTRLEAFSNLLKKAESKAVLIGVVRKKRDPLDECSTETAYSETQ